MPDSDAGTQARVVAGRYRLVRELGRGGMGVVWLAEDQLVGRQVAVKELRPPEVLAAGERENFTARVLGEARSAARMHHPGAVTLFDVLPAAAGDDAMYLVMELVAGPTLAGVIAAQGRLADQVVAGYGVQLATVLAAAHQMGIVHRDVKPANIMITAGGQVKLTDFGIAHTVGDPRLTASGIMGTQAYMAPELFEGAPISPAADVWSLGATLFAAVAGRGPFERDTTGSTLRAILVDAIPVPYCSPALAAALNGMLQRDPARRATLAQARAQLQTAARTPATTIRPANGPATIPPANGPATIPPANGPATVTTAQGAGHPAPPAPPQPWAHLAATRAPTAPQPWAPPPARPPRRIGTRTAAIAAAVVLVAAAAITAAILTTRHGSSNGASLSTGTSPSHGPTHPAPTATSPGKVIAKLSDPDIGHGAITVTSTIFTADGKTLIVTDGDGNIYLWDTATLKMTASMADPNSGGLGSAALSPDGQTLATADSNGNAYLWSMATHSITATIPDPNNHKVVWVAFSPNGQTLAVGDADGTTYLWSTASHSITGSVADPNSQGLDAVAFSPNGQTLATADSNGSTYLWNLAAPQSPAATLTDPNANVVFAIAFSPDGQTVATADGNGSTFVWNTASHSLVATLTDPGGGQGVNAVAFSPDGKTLATADADDSTYLWSTASYKMFGTLADPGGGIVNAVAFSPGGQTLATGDGHGEPVLWQIVTGG